MPAKDLKKYILSIIEDLMDPMVRVIYGTIEGEQTIILCESILALLPTFVAKDTSYRTLKAYDIMPISTGVLSSKN